MDLVRSAPRPDRKMGLPYHRATTCSRVSSWEEEPRSQSRTGILPVTLGILPVDQNEELNPVTECSCKFGHLVSGFSGPKNSDRQDAGPTVSVQIFPNTQTEILQRRPLVRSYLDGSRGGQMSALPNFDIARCHTRICNRCIPPDSRPLSHPAFESAALSA